MKFFGITITQEQLGLIAKVCKEIDINSFVELEMIVKSSKVKDSVGLMNLFNNMHNVQIVKSFPKIKCLGQA